MSFSVRKLARLDVQTLLLADWVLPVSTEPIPSGFVALNDGHIVAVGRQEDLGNCLPTPINTKNAQLISPGLINAHTHLEQSLGKQIHKTAEQPMSEWLAAVKQEMSAQDVNVSLETGIAEVLASGVTCVGDLCQNDETFERLAHTGLRGLISLEFFHPNAEVLNYSFLEDLLSRYDRLKGAYRHLAVGLAPHAPFNVSPQAWRFLLAQTSARFHTHLAESQDEVAYLQGRPSAIDQLHLLFLNRTFQPDGFADSPVKYLAHHGLLNERTFIAHGIECDASDIAMLKAAGVGLVHCPTSNLHLHAKTIQAADWTVPIALGTDGHLSTGHLDIRQEARLAIALHHWDAQKALRHLTLEGAQVLGFQECIGSLEVGKSADLVCWEYSRHNTLSCPEDLLLHKETRVKQSFVAGREIYCA